MKVRLIPDHWRHLLALQSIARQFPKRVIALRYKAYGNGATRSRLRVLPALLFVVSLVTVLLVSTVPGATVQPLRSEIRGVWLTTNDTIVLRDRAKVQDAMAQLRRLNFNTVYPVVWNAGYALYPSAVVRQAGIQNFVYRGLQGQDILADLIAQGHQKGLLVVPWFEFGFMAPPTSELALQHPDWLTQKRDGGQTSISAAGEVVWLNPFRPEVQQFITSLVLEIITQYDADGIQFDDHMSLPAEFGYDDYTIALYTQETKKAPPSNPQDAAWVRWRADKITAFMTRLHKAVKERNPQAVFSVSPNYYDFAYRLHLQDWLAWVRQNLVDELIVQVYRSDLQSFLEQINRSEIQETQRKVPTGIGILTGLRNNPVSMQRIQAQVRASQSRGLGVSFFYYESLWNYASEPIADRQSGFQALFPYPALRSAIE
ncbi:glycoside hydrolase family 10 protein [Leptolyngbya sp. FACHB-711]|uniref:glycoside hydrolase family 10 protein n=1 Tax=unclassified Leptolyngbya TaxID=2650499 RepID=UPI0016872AA8|nr:glycoside hydrolase family 10 protein [Leptolyngbya sp. FACHB-711]MBD1850873.1 glycoside hydrolase family 10 protein [Cyanobacteria bacterium FACHB-502]MBD2024001.1 glycoside hydrolase family 10 protein [Leptolyngbya sp. FACHB-711]